MSKAEITELPIKTFNVTEQYFSSFIPTVAPTDEELRKTQELEQEYQETYKHDIKKLFALGSTDIIIHALKQNEQDIFQWIDTLTNDELSDFLEDSAKKTITMPKAEKDSEEDSLSLFVLLTSILARKENIFDKKPFTDKLMNLAASGDLESLNIVKDFFEESLGLDDSPEKVVKYFSFLFEGILKKTGKHGEEILAHLVDSAPFIFSRIQSVEHLMDYSKSYLYEHDLSISPLSYMSLFSSKKTDEDNFIHKALRTLVEKARYNKIASNPFFLYELGKLFNFGEKGIEIFNDIANTLKSTIDVQEFGIFLTDLAFKIPHEKDFIAKIIAKDIHLFLLNKDFVGSIKDLSVGMPAHRELLVEIISQSIHSLMVEKTFLKSIGNLAFSTNISTQKLFTEILLRNSDEFLENEREFGFFFNLFFQAKISTTKESFELMTKTAEKIFINYTTTKVLNLESIKQFTLILASQLESFEKLPTSLKSAITNFLNQNSASIDKLIETSCLSEAQENILKSLGFSSNLTELIYDPLGKMKNDCINKFLKKIKTDLSSPKDRDVLIEKLVKGLLLAKKDDVAFKMLEAASDIPDLSINFFQERDATRQGAYNPSSNKLNVFNTKKIIENDVNSQDFIDFISCIIHELTHAVLQNLYGNTCESFVEDDVIFKKDFETTVKEVVDSLEKRDTEIVLEKPFLLLYASSRHSSEIPAFFVESRVQQKLKELTLSKEPPSYQETVLLSNTKLTDWMKNLAKVVDKSVVLYDDKVVDQSMALSGEIDDMTQDALDFV